LQNIDLETNYWGKTKAALARILGVSYYVVRYNRMKGHYGQPDKKWSHDKPNGVRPRTAALLSMIDFSETDAEIGCRYGFTREYARQLRILKAAPKVHRPTPKQLWARKYIRERKLGLQGLTIDQIHDSMPFISKNLLRKILISEGVVVRRDYRYPYELMNWGLSNRVLAQVWGMNPSGHIYLSLVRKLRNFGKPLFDGRKRKQLPNPIYNTHLQTELRKASEYRRTRQALGCSQ
jgi:hypothetical protein